MNSLNKIIIAGRIGQDVEVRTLTDGGRVAEFGVATSESWKDRETGEWVERTEWHTVVTFQDGLISILEKHALKGRLVAVVGKLQYRSYRKEGEVSDRQMAEIMVDIRGEVEFMSPKLKAGW